MSGTEGSAGPSVEDLHFGARVFSSDGRHVGSLSFLIVDAESFDVHAIVVTETGDFSGHRLSGAALVEENMAIPISGVAHADRERITLSLTASQVRQSGPYLTYRFAPAGRGDQARKLAGQLGDAAYAPPLVEDAHKRLDELEIRGGENVMLGDSGRKLGTVRDLVMDRGELAGVVIHPEGWFREDVFLQVRFLGRSDDLALFARLRETDLDHLTPFHPAHPATTG